MNSDDSSSIPPNKPHFRAGAAVELNRSQAEFEIDFYGQILQRFPDHLDVLKYQAKLLAGAGRRAEGLACDERLVAALPHDPLVRYHLACSLAAVGRTDEALRTLAQAVELGYDDFAHLEIDPDLESLRHHPRFLALVRGHGMAS